MGHLLRLWAVPRREKQVFFEAVALLVLSQLAVKTIGFRHIYNLLVARWTSGMDTSDRADDIELVNMSVSRAAKLLPSKRPCLSRSIAAFVMLRRRGVPTVMFAGVKFVDSSLLAHAWVRAGNKMMDTNAEHGPFTPLVSIGRESTGRH